jgi:hypothetical protein
MNVHILTLEQKEMLVGQMWNNQAYFNPTLDANGNWFISNEEVNGCEKPEFAWVKELAEIDYNPVVVEFPI